MKQNDLVPEPLAKLLNDWMIEAELFRRRGAEAQALAIETMAEEVREAHVEHLDAPLTLKQASDESGYTLDHLGRQVRSGRIPNAGQTGVPRILRRHLPRKLRRPLAVPNSDVSSREQIARSVVDSG